MCRLRLLWLQVWVWDGSSSRVLPSVSLSAGDTVHLQAGQGRQEKSLNAENHANDLALKRTIRRDRELRGKKRRKW